MKKIMKWFLRIFGILLLLIIATAIIIPVFFKDQIVQIAKDETNKQINAKVDFGDFSLSLFRTFPDFSLKVKNVSVAGIDEFEGDTLALIPELYLKIDLMSVFKGDEYKIKTIELKDPKISLKVLHDGKANWDITKPSEEPETDDPQVSEPSKFALNLQNLSIKNATIIYDDKEADMYAKIIGMNHSLKGDFTASTTTIDTKTEIKELDYKMEGIYFLRKAKLDIQAKIDADLDNEKYGFLNNQIQLNELAFSLDGFFAMKENGYDMDINYVAKENTFRSFLSLVPAVWSQDFADLQTDGQLQFEGFVKGLYTEESLPAFNLQINVANAMFKYPDLPKSVSNININAQICNKGGSADNTIINIPAFSMTLGSDPFSMKANISKPVSDPLIDAAIKGKIDLAGLGDFYPLAQGEKLSGIVNSDIAFKGKLSSIEQEKYSEFEAKGSVVIKDLHYTTADLPDPIEISDMNLLFTPQTVRLENFAMKTGKSDIQARGNIDNLLMYVFKDELLKGNFSLTSNYLNLNPFMESEETSTATDTEAASSEIEIFEVPANIDFTLQTEIGKLHYDNMEMTGVSGIVVIKDRKISMDKLKMNMLGGSLLLNGFYETTNPLKPFVGMDLSISGFDFRKSWETFGTIKTFIPIMEKATGNYSTTFSFSSFLDNTMSPVYESMNGTGSMRTSNVAVRGINTLDKISDALKMEDMKRMMFQNLNILFEFKDGKFFVKPFDFAWQSMKGKVEGWNSFDESMRYVVNLEIPTAMMGAQAKAAVNGLMGEASKLTGRPMALGNTAEVDVFITGTISDPVVKTGIKDAMGSAADNLKDQVKDEINAKKEELEQKARDEAERLKKEAEDKLRQETDKATQEAERAKKEAEDKAKKEADRLKKEAEDKAKKEAEDAKKKLKNIFK